MADPIYNILFLCSGNSARSVIAEGLMRHLGVTRGFQAFSAASRAHDAPHPMALKVLAEHDIAIEGLRSKSWSVFEQPGAPEMDFIVTLCDVAAGEVCPNWPGAPLTAHWGLPDPAAVEGDDAQRAHAFLDAFLSIKRRIELMLALPIDTLDRIALHHHVRHIGTH